MRFSKNDRKKCRIAIIGAGPGGLSAAEALKMKGYQNVTLFERSLRPGGQSLSIRFTAPDHHEGVYELGSICPLSSKVLYRLFKKYGLHLGKSPLKLGDLNKSNLLYTRVYSEEKKEFIVDFFRYKTGFPRERTIDWLFDIAKLARFLFRYRGLAKPGVDHVSDEILQELSISYQDWVNNAHFRILTVALEATIGSIATLADNDTKKTMSALLCFKFIFQSLHYPFRYIDGSLRLVKEGYQELWRRVAQNHHVLYKANIKSIIRHPNDGIKIELVDGQTYTFDKIIVSCSPTQALKVLDASEEEIDIFKRILYSAGWRIAFIAKNIMKDGVIASADPYYKFNHKPALVVYYPEMQIDEENWLFTGFITCNRVVNISKYLPEIETYICRNFNQGNRQAEVVQWINTAYWNEYGPHFSIEDTRNGIYKRYEALQGVNNTYYVGGAIASSSHATIVEYSFKRINDFF